MAKGLPRSLKAFREKGGAGAPAGTGVSVREEGDGAMRKSILRFVNTPVVLADNAGVTAFGSLKVYDFPAGMIYVLAAQTDIALTKSSAGVIDTWDGDIGIGTVAANNTATPLATTEQDIIQNTATPQAVSGVTTADSVRNTVGAVFDGTSTAVDAYVNLLVDDTDHDVTTTPCNLILNGTLTLIWTSAGDV